MCNTLVNIVLQQYVHEIPDSKKNQKSVAFESPVSQRVAVPERSRSTYGHAAIRDANGQFMCYVHVHNSGKSLKSGRVMQCHS